MALCVAIGCGGGDFAGEFARLECATLAACYPDQLDLRFDGNEAACRADTVEHYAELEAENKGCTLDRDAVDACFDAHRAAVDGCEEAALGAIFDRCYEDWWTCPS